MAPSSSGGVTLPLYGGNDEDPCHVEKKVEETEVVVTSPPSNDKQLHPTGRFPSSAEHHGEDPSTNKQPSQLPLSPSGKTAKSEVKSPASPPSSLSSSSSSSSNKSSSLMPTASLLPLTSSSLLRHLPQSQSAHIHASADSTEEDVSHSHSPSLVTAATRKRRRLEHPISTTANTALPIAVSSGGIPSSVPGVSRARVTRGSNRRPRGGGRRRGQQPDSSEEDDNDSGGEMVNNSDAEELNRHLPLPPSHGRGNLTRSTTTLSPGAQAIRLTRSRLRSSSTSPTFDLGNTPSRTGTRTPTSPSPLAFGSRRSSPATSTLRAPSMRGSRKAPSTTTATTMRDPLIAPIAQGGQATRRMGGSSTAAAEFIVPESSPDVDVEGPSSSPPSGSRGGSGLHISASTSMISGQPQHHRLPSGGISGSGGGGTGSYYHHHHHHQPSQHVPSSTSSSYPSDHAPTEYAPSYPPSAFNAGSSSMRDDGGSSYSSGALGSRSVGQQRRRHDEYEGETGTFSYDDEGEDEEAGRMKASSTSEYEEDVEMRDAYAEDQPHGGDHRGHHSLRSSSGGGMTSLSSSDVHAAGGGGSGDGSSRWGEQPSLTHVRRTHGAPLASYAPTSSDYTLPPHRSSPLPYGSASASGGGMMVSAQGGAPLLPSPSQIHPQPSSHHHHVQHPTSPPAGTSASATATTSIGGGTKKRGNLPREVTELLKSWILSHADNPYPTDEEKKALCAQTGLTYIQVSNWMINVSFSAFGGGKRGDTNDFGLGILVLRAFILQARRRVLPPENKHKYQRPSAVAILRPSSSGGGFSSGSPYGGGGGPYSSPGARPSFAFGPPSFGAGAGAGRHSATSSSSSHHLSPLELPAPGSLDPLPQLDSATTPRASSSLTLSPLQWTSQPPADSPSSSPPSSTSTRQVSHSPGTGTYWAPSLRSMSLAQEMMYTHSHSQQQPARSQSARPTTSSSSSSTLTASPSTSRAGGGRPFSPPPSYTPTRSRTPGPNQDTPSSSSARSRGRGGVLSIEELAAYGYTPAQAAYVASRERDRDRERERDRGIDRTRTPPPRR